ncbi:signal peptide peptidase SppA [Phytoactinopolyspora halotolerans]|uniref:Signal peptide peptidase SppA n=1 Tax=Phytoactinopolyspora halotolerans TaxID=1981512 RepID=A0A6L9SHM5_9ACTN|nr:signal peptide peptidase SppA [Phytoactinopolyspora halotolerans]NEE04746.1 signal peptide peptidase SppA [Phytoactinopolyspora halotolerans]
MSVAPLVLELELHTPLSTVPPQDPLTAIRARNRAQLSDVLEGLRRAAKDSKVAALVAQCDGGTQTPAVVQELRDAVLEFRRSGKPAVAWAQSFGELGPGTLGYYLASAFDEIWVQPSGDVGLTGLSARAVFLREALDQLGLQPQLSQRHEYKNAANMFTESEFTEAHRESLTRIVESMGEQIITAVADARDIDPQRLRDLIDAGPASADDAMAAGLIDTVGYRDEVYHAVNRSVGGRMRLRYVSRYNHARTKNDAMLRAPIQRRRGYVALVYGHGAITVGRSSASPFAQGSMGSDTISAALRAAVRDDSVKAIVFRVDSPGGSYVASDTIRREVLLARRRKPVVASMGSVAGSGGYFVTMAADAVVASPATITGSIGVVGGKISPRRLLDRLGIHVASVNVGQQADMFSSDEPFTDEQWEIVNRWMDRVYDDFTAKVAEDRKLARDHVLDVARGRIWTGADAREHGLVDELGGLTTAIQAARDRGGLPYRDDLADVRTYPRVPFLERLRPAESSQSPAATGTTVRAHAPLSDVATALGLPSTGALTMPFVPRT